MFGSRNREEMTSVKHVFFKNYHQSSSFELILLLEIIKCLKFIWLGTAGMQFENTSVISTAKTESRNKKNKPHTSLFHSTEVFWTLSWLWLLFLSHLPYVHMNGNALARERAAELNLLGTALGRRSAAFSWWKCWFPEGNWTAFPYPHPFQETREPLQNKYCFVGCKKLLLAILLLCFLGFEYPSLLWYLR